MGCGCKRNKGSLPTRNVNTNPARNIVANSRGSEQNMQPAQQRNIAPPQQKIVTNPNKTPVTDPKVANMNLNIQKTQNNGMSKERLEIEKRRREAIRRALGK